jgi:hypothetical protein
MKEGATHKKPNEAKIHPVKLGNRLPPACRSGHQLSPRTPIRGEIQKLPNEPIFLRGLGDKKCKTNPILTLP